VWDGRGYPPLVTESQLKGSVVHLVIERITGALRESGVQDLESDVGISVLRQLGGFQGLISDAIGVTLKRNEDNPRFSPHAARAKRDLERSVPQMRNYIKARLLTLALHHGGGAPLPAPSSDGRLGLGLRTEVFLSVSSLRLHGVVDLIDVQHDYVRIIEYKSGDPSPSHADQVRMYEVLWAEDMAKNPEATPIRNIILQYPQQSQEMSPFSEGEMRSFRVDLVKRIDRAFAAISSPRPSANVAPDTCRYCDVRHLCDEYWQSARKAMEVTAEGIKDLEAVFGNQHGAHTWNVRTSGPREEPALLSLSDSASVGRLSLLSGLRYRLLGVYVQGPSEPGEATQPQIIVGQFSEVFRVDEKDASSDYSMDRVSSDVQL
jgi:hypothetical protein